VRSDVLTALAADVDALVQVPVGSLSMAQLQAVGAAVAPLAHRLDGLLSLVTGELEVRGGGTVPDGDTAAVPTAAWLRDTASVSGRTAGRQVRTAVALRELPQITQAILDGVLTVEHGRVLTRLVGKAPAQTLLESEPALIEVARRTDPDQLAHYVRHLLATWCEPDLEQDEAAAEDRRFLQLTNKHNGSWRGSFELPDADMEQVLAVLEPLARRDGLDDRRTAGQRRADALRDVFGLALRHGDLPDAGGSRPRLSYVIPLGWQPDLTGDRHAPVDPDRPAAAGCPAAAWTGPATRTRISTLLCDAQVERVVLDPDGRIISLTAEPEQITAAQRRAVATRDRCCTAKGCSRPPAFCDVHHLIARADGGSNDTTNLVLLCRRHHTLWHRRQLTLKDLRVPWLRLPQPRAPDAPP
jgi:hypothetical protein